MWPLSYSEYHKRLHAVTSHFIVAAVWRGGAAVFLRFTAGGADVFLRFAVGGAGVFVRFTAGGAAVFVRFTAGGGGRLRLLCREWGGRLRLLWPLPRMVRRHHRCAVSCGKGNLVVAAVGCGVQAVLIISKQSTER